MASINTPDVDTTASRLSSPPSLGIFSTWAVARLRESLAASGILFDRQLRDRVWSPTRWTEALTSTAIALIGLSRAEVDSAEVGMDLVRTRESMVELFRRSRVPGPLGLLIWANAVTDGPSLEAVLGRSGHSIEDVASLAKRLRTMELAWLVAGLTHERHRSGSRRSGIGLESATRALLERFESRSQTFRHADADSPWMLSARRRVATFADQAYPVQALAMVSMATGDARSLEVASVSALRMAEIQGDRGQWWWHHDPVDGRVSGAYPVYSVHQHGMVPMAFRTLTLAGGPDLSQAVELGRNWLSHNELGVDLVDRQAGTIWRSIERSEGPLHRLSRHARALAGRLDDRPGSRVVPLRVNHETRPYEWGWCLFALAIESGAKPPEHLA